MVFSYPVSVDPAERLLLGDVLLDEPAFKNRSAQHTIRVGSRVVRIEQGLRVHTRA